MAAPQHGSDSAILPVYLGGVEASIVTENISQTIGLLQAITATKTVNLSQTIGLSPVVFRLIYEDITMSVGLVQDIDALVVWFIENVLGLSNVVARSRFTVNCANRVFFDTPYGEGGQSATHNYIFADISDILGLTQALGYDWQADIVQYLGFTPRYRDDSANNILGLIAQVRIAVQKAASNTFSWIEHDDIVGTPGKDLALKRVYMVDIPLGLVQTIAGATKMDIYDELDLQDVIDASTTEYDRPVSQIGFKQALTYRIDRKCVEKTYSPQIGETSDMEVPTMPATPPNLGTGVLTLTYPRVSPSLTLTLRNPEFGDETILMLNRIDRSTRGGDRVLFTDPNWPTIQTLKMTVRGICTADADEVIAFLNASAGSEIGLADWEGRSWKGFISEPNTDITAEINDRYSLSLTFEGELV